MVGGLGLGRENAAGVVLYVPLTTHLVRVVAHPTQYWGWFLLFAAVILVLIGGGILINRRLLTAPAQ